MAESSGEVLMNMYNFYKKRYATNQSEMERRFNNAVEDLISTGDIKKAEYIKFCVTHDIEPKVEEKPTTTRGSYSAPSYPTYGDSCGSGGGGRTYTRGGC